MLLDAEGDGEDDVAFLSGIKDIDLNKYIDRKTRKCLVLLRWFLGVLAHTTA